MPFLCFLFSVPIFLLFMFTTILSPPIIPTLSAVSTNQPPSLHKHNLHTLSPFANHNFLTLFGIKPLNQRVFGEDFGENFVPKKMQSSSVISLSPSFNSYSNRKLAEIAARVVEEFGSEEFYEEIYFEGEQNPDTAQTPEEEDSECVEREKGDRDAPEEDDDEEEEFEFAFVNKETEIPSPIPADEIFHNGQIRPIYPVFNRDLFLERVEFQQENEKDKKGVRNSDSEKSSTIRLPLRQLFIEDRETRMTMTTTSSSSSSEADELDGVPEDSYCVWRPKEAAADGRCKKSSSAGSNSKRWKFKDLLHRSHSDGSKGNLVILSPSNNGRKSQNEQRGKETAGSSGKLKAPAGPPPPPVYKRDGGEKRRSYLPYRPDLLGLFANVNGMSKNLQPF